MHRATDRPFAASLGLLLGLALALAGCGGDSFEQWSVAGTWTGTGQLYLIDGTTPLGTLDEVFEFTQEGAEFTGTLTEQGFGATFRFTVSGKVSEDTFAMTWIGPDHCSPPGRYIGPATKIDDDTIQFVVRGSDCDGSFRVEGEIHRSR